VTFSNNHRILFLLEMPMFYNANGVLNACFRFLVPLSKQSPP